MTPLRRTRTLARLGVGVLLSGLALSLAGDAAVLASPQEGEQPAPVPAVKADGEEAPAKPQPVKPPKPVPVKPTVSDPGALALLEKAAKQQGGAELAEPDALKSFHVLFHAAKFSVERSQEDGSSKRITFDTDTRGLEIAWMVPDYLRTDWTQDGKKTTRAFHSGKGDEGVNWMRDPDQPGRVIVLSGDRYRTDREQIERDRRMIRTLLDVVFLERLRRDGSTWTPSDAAYPFAATKGPAHVKDTKNMRAIVRHPPGGSAEDASQLGMALWIDTVTGKVGAAYIKERATGDQPLYFALGYNADFPKRIGTEAKFPFGVAVYEDPKGKPIMSLSVAEIHVNDAKKVNLATFTPGKKPKRAPEKK